MSRCPPGVICIENITLFFIMVVIFSVSLGIIYLSKNNNLSKIEYRNIIDLPNNNISTGLIPKASYTYSNVENDVLLNPYEGPTRDNRLFPNLNIFSTRMPINTPTQSFDTSYRQIGILTRIGSDKEMILPLMGRPLITNRDKWNFYTMSDKNSMIKLPIKYKKRNCTADIGCDDLYTGDVVKVEGYSGSFKVTTYENDMPKYIPYI
jgi:hypothetical protein